MIWQWGVKTMIKTLNPVFIFIAFLPIFLFFPDLLFSQEWEVLKQDDSFYLENFENRKLRLKIHWTNGTPKFEKVLPIDQIDPVVLLIYFAM